MRFGEFPKEFACFIVVLPENHGIPESGIWWVLDDCVNDISIEDITFAKHRPKILKGRQKTGREVYAGVFSITLDPSKEDTWKRDPGWFLARYLAPDEDAEDMCGQHDLISDSQVERSIARYHAKHSNVCTKGAIL